MSKVRTTLKGLLVLLIIAVGVGVLLALKSMKPEPERKEPPDPSIVVQVVKPEQGAAPVTIQAMGTVIPARKVEVFPEVGGRIVKQSDELVPGGRIPKGKMIVRIDPRDYNLALAQQSAAVTKAQMDLATEKARKEVAEREWALIADEVQPSEEGKKLALREVQLETAEASLKSAKSGLSKARLARSRTTIRAPFNVLVTEEFVDRGQLVGPATRIATLVDADVFWVRVSVPVDRLPWIALPDARGDGGSLATITQRVADGVEVVRQGRVVKLLADLEPQGKMARLLVEVEDPLGTDGAEGGQQLPLLLGAYVNVDISGPELTDVIALPRRALRDNGQIWLKNGNQLQIRDVDVIWSTADKVFVRGELSAQDDIVISRIAAPVEGMPLRINGEKPAAVVDSGPPGTTSGSASSGAAQ
jgi:RND family efflux transporter MFP subunit